MRLSNRNCSCDFKALAHLRYQEMYVKLGAAVRPVGHAFRTWFGRTNGLMSQYEKAKSQFNFGDSTDGLLLALQLAARDVESTVILGDPTAATPGLA